MQAARWVREWYGQGRGSARAMDGKSVPGWQWGQRVLQGECRAEKDILQCCQQPFYTPKVLSGFPERWLPSPQGDSFLFFSWGPQWL